MGPIPILLIDDHALFRSGMRLILQSAIPYAEVLEASSLEQAVHDCTEPPSLVLLDIQLNGVNGLDGLVLLQQRWPEVPVVMLSSDLDPATARAALLRGAVAYVSKAGTAEKIIHVIQQALAGQLPAAAQTNAHQGLPEADSKPRLTPRQCEVLDLLCEGLSNKLIARRLELSEFTVRGHVQSVFVQLHVSSRATATAKARRIGLVG